MMVYLTRKVEFEASHYYWLPELSEGENWERFGRQSRRHGHNYVLYVTVQGPVDPKHGMVVNIKDVDRILREEILRRYDHTLIPKQHPAFQKRLATSENLAIQIWQEVEPHLAPARLHQVRVEASPTLYASYRGEGSMVILTRVYEFSASHRLHTPRLTDEENRAAYGKCNNPLGHGHNYVLEVSVRGEVDPRLGLAVDPSMIDEQVKKQVLDRLDYVHINDVEPFDTISPTSENLVIWMWQQLAADLPGLYRLRLHETSKSYFDYYGESHELEVH